MQVYPAGEYEIIVVDDAGCEHTREVVEDYAARAKQAPPGQQGRKGPSAPQRICYLAATETQGPAAARNLGWRNAQGQFIAFTDDDCIPKPDWLKEGVAALMSGLDGASGRIIVPLSGRPTDYEKNTSLLSESEFVTANCFYRRSALEAVGGFDESFKMAWREDSELFFRLLENSYKLGRAPGARVVHPVRPARWGVSLSEQRKSLYNALLFKKYRSLYRTRIQPLPPIRYYLIVLSALVGAAALLLGSRGAALGAGLVWLLLTLQFAWQRLRQTRRTPGHVFEMLVTSMLIPPLSVYWRLAGAWRYRVLFF